MPFRSVAAAVDALRAERSRLADELAATRPWSWNQFCRGAVLPIVVVVIVALGALTYDALTPCIHAPARSSCADCVN
jgi:hypothetical protein